MSFAAMLKSNDRLPCRPRPPASASKQRHGKRVPGSIRSDAVLGLPALQALLLGALVAPTDPVVSSSIVTGDLAEEHVDADARHLISAESGVNDGLAFLLVMLPALLLESSPAKALVHWTVVSLLGKVSWPRCSMPPGRR